MCNISTITSVVSAVTALFAVIFGPFIAARASLRGMLGPMRQAWINNLRDTIAGFIAAIGVGNIQTSSQLSDDDKIRQSVEDARKEHLRKTFEMKERIHLLVNATEPDHIELVRLVDSAFEAFNQNQDTTLALRELRRWAQVVIKHEWNAIKGK